MGARDSTDPYDSALPWPDTPPPLTVRGALRRTFGSLDSFNYRVYFVGDLVSYVGSWMQTMAEAWLVWDLTKSGAAVGATFAFRFLPVLFLGLWGGVIADRFDRRKVLLVTQSLAALLAVALWLVVLAGVVQVWMVFAFAVALGLVTVVDEPAKHAFVEEMVGRDRVPNAVALSSAMRNSARITGPALAGLLIALAGVSLVFLVNAVSFFAVVAALLLMRVSELQRSHEPTARPRVREGLRYAWSLVDIRSTIVLVFVVGTLVYNFPTFLTLMASEGFGGGAGLAGLLMAILGVGTVIGGLAAAMWARASGRIVIGAAAALGCSLIVAAALSSQIAFEVALVPVGAMAVFFGTVANSHMQVSSALPLRGRVMAIYTLLTLGTTVVGGPFVGWMCQQWSPRTGLAVAGVATFVAAVVLSLPLTARLRAPDSRPEPVAPTLAVGD
jgi:MFS family permease